MRKAVQLSSNESKCEFSNLVCYISAQGFSFLSAPHSCVLAAALPDPVRMSMCWRPKSEKAIRQQQH
eukprot:4741112-Prymnesium_polylepis.1